jgi:hypothetical protein
MCFILTESAPPSEIPPESHTGEIEVGEAENIMEEETAVGVASSVQETLGKVCCKFSFLFFFEKFCG